MTRTIRRWTDNGVIWEGEAETVKDALHRAIAAGADLRGADLTRADLTRADLRGAVLRGADLTGAVLTRADLRGAVLRGAVLRGADLTGAVLTGAVLTDAVLTGAVLTGAGLTGAVLTDAVLTDAVLTDAVLTDAVLTDAVLTRADLTGADLTGADRTRADLRGAVLRGADLPGAVLTDADLTPIRDDYYAVLSSAPAEVPALIAALKEGRVNGSTYSGACACLLGTLANARQCAYTAIPGLTPNSQRPAERFFLLIRFGDTPATSQAAQIACGWAEDWLARMRAAFSTAREGVRQ